MVTKDEVKAAVLAALEESNNGCKSCVNFAAEGDPRAALHEKHHALLAPFMGPLEKVESQASTAGAYLFWAVFVAALFLLVLAFTPIKISQILPVVKAIDR